MFKFLAKNLIKRIHNHYRMIFKGRVINQGNQILLLKINRV